VPKASPICVERHKYPASIIKKIDDLKALMFRCGNGSCDTDYSSILGEKELIVNLAKAMEKGTVLCLWCKKELDFQILAHITIRCACGNKFDINIDRMEAYDTGEGGDIDFYCDECDPEGVSARG